jgi:hypothetical protein
MSTNSVRWLFWEAPNARTNEVSACFAIPSNTDRLALKYPSCIVYLKKLTGPSKSWRFLQVATFDPIAGDNKY